MKDSQEFKGKVVLPIKTVEQLATSYMVAQIIVEIRGELETEAIAQALDTIPKLEGKVPTRLQELYESAAKIMNFKPILIYTLKYAIEDMITYSFSEDPSVVVAANSDTSHLKIAFGQSFSTLSKVNLEEHTINVFEEAILSAKGKGRSSGILLPLLGALMHDFGKSTGIRTELLGEAGSRGYKAHSEVSGMYIRDLLSIRLYNKFQEIPEETISILSELVKNHHPSNVKSKTDPGVAFIIGADHKARKKEYKRLLKAKADS